MPEKKPGTLPEDAPRQVQGRRGFSVFYKGKTLLSCFDPISQAERLVEARKFPDQTLCLCPSPLYGYGLERLLRCLEQSSPHSAVLCVETDEQLLALSLNKIPPSLLNHPLLRLTGIGDPAKLCAFVRKTWGSRSFRRIEVLRLSAGWRLDPESYDLLADTLRKELVLDWGNAITLVRLGRLYIRNVVRNLRLIPRSPSLGGFSFHADPVLVLGAGPSLDDILEGLAGFFGEALSASPRRPFRILAVDTALSCLRERKIKPDLVAALESQHWNLRDFIGTGDWKIPVVMDLSALPATGEMLGGQSFLFYTPWAELRLFQRLETAGVLPVHFPPLGSVALSAVAIALSLGSGPVITGGIDFSFTLDKYHARAAPGHREKLRRQNRFRGILNTGAAFRPAVFRAAAKSGVPIRCDPALRGYRDLFEREFAGEKRLRDITGDGLPLGIPAVDMTTACKILEGPAAPESEAAAQNMPAAPEGRKAGTLQSLVVQEREALAALRRILTGESAASPGELEARLDAADYLWAHFPDCAGAGGRRPPGTDLSFLKRVRAELDPFIGLWELALKELAR